MVGKDNALDLSSLQRASATTTHIKANIAPQQTLEKPKDFSKIRQGIGTNSFTKLRPDQREDGNTKIDRNGTATIKQGDYIVTILNYAQLTGLRTSTYQLLDALTISLTETGAKSPTVILSLSEYMKRRALKDRKEARKQIVADLNLLLQTNITWKEKRRDIPEGGMNMVGDWEWNDKKKTTIKFTFAQKFYSILLGYPVMEYPNQLQRLNGKKNPNSYYLLRKIAELKNINAGHENGEDIISVKTLLENAPFIPSYDEVMSGNRNLVDRIIKPFERDMNALSDTLTWYYCYSKGVTDDKIEETPYYNDFITYYVKIIWRDYPDQTERLERKAQQIEENAKKKEKRDLAKARAKGKREAELEAEERKQAEESEEDN